MFRASNKAVMREGFGRRQYSPSHGRITNGTAIIMQQRPIGMIRASTARGGSGGEGWGGNERNLSPRQKTYHGELWDSEKGVAFGGPVTRLQCLLGAFTVEHSMRKKAELDQNVHIRGCQ